MIILIRIRALKDMIQMGMQMMLKLMLFRTKILIERIKVTILIKMYPRIFKI